MTSMIHPKDVPKDVSDSLLRAKAEMWDRFLAVIMDGMNTNVSLAVAWNKATGQMQRLLYCPACGDYHNADDWPHKNRQV